MISGHLDFGTLVVMKVGGKSRCHISDGFFVGNVFVVFTGTFIMSHVGNTIHKASVTNNDIR